MLFILLIQFPRKRCGKSKKTDSKSRLPVGCLNCNPGNRDYQNMYIVINMILLKHCHDSSPNKENCKMRKQYFDENECF